MANRDVLFKRINNALFDMQAATSQTFEQHFLTYARLFADSSLQPLNQQLTANLDVDQFLEASSRSQGSMVGSARLAWPESADEVLGLRWSDIDLDTATLSIRRSVSCTGYQVHTTPTKTRTSRRAIDLDQRTVEVLRDWRHHQLDELGSAASDGPCSPVPTADPFTPTRCRRPSTACNVPQVSPRSGCTTCATHTRR